MVLRQMMQTTGKCSARFFDLPMTHFLSMFLSLSLSARSQTAFHGLVLLACLLELPLFLAFRDLSFLTAGSGGGSDDDCNDVYSFDDDGGGAWVVAPCVPPLALLSFWGPRRCDAALAKRLARRAGELTRVNARTRSSLSASQHAL